MKKSILSKIAKRGIEIAKQCEGDWTARFALGMKQAWSEYKASLEKKGENSMEFRSIEEIVKEGMKFDCEEYLQKKAEEYENYNVESSRITLKKRRVYELLIVEKKKIADYIESFTDVAKRSNARKEITGYRKELKKAIREYQGFAGAGNNFGRRYFG